MSNASSTQFLAPPRVLSAQTTSDLDLLSSHRPFQTSTSTVTSRRVLTHSSLSPERTYSHSSTLLPPMFSKHQRAQPSNRWSTAIVPPKDSRFGSRYMPSNDGGMSMQSSHLFSGHRYTFMDTLMPPSQISPTSRHSSRSPQVPGSPGGAQISGVKLRPINIKSFKPVRTRFKSQKSEHTHVSPLRYSHKGRLSPYSTEDEEEGGLAVPLSAAELTSRSPQFSPHLSYLPSALSNAYSETLYANLQVSL